MTVDSARRVFEVSGSDAGGRRSESEDSCSEGWSTWIRSEPHRRTQHSRTQHSRTPHLSALPRSLHDRWAAVSPSRILPGRHRLWSLSRLGCLRAGAHRPSARRLALFGLALLLGGIDGEACRAAACPHQRRADLPTTSPPTQSGETIECPAGVFSSIRGTGVGGGAPPTICPRWVTTGLTYHRKEPAPGMRVVDEEIVESTITHFYCDDETWLFGLIVSYECRELDTAIHEVQLTALSDADCEALGTSPSSPTPPVVRP